jgi:hypothetical protein
MIAQWSWAVQDVTTLVSLVAGFVSLLQFGWERYHAWRDAKDAARSLEEEATEAALNSNDLDTLGAYVYRNLGAVTLDNYARNEVVQKRLDSVAHRVAQFVSPEGDPNERDEPLQAAPVGTDAPTSTISALATKHGLHNAEAEIRSGNLWNGLAELRRVLETRFREIAAAHDVRREKLGARRLLLELARRELVPEQCVAFFEFAIEVANRGVHGLEVSLFESLEALNAAAQGLEIVDQYRRAV